MNETITTTTYTLHGFLSMTPTNDPISWSICAIATVLVIALVYVSYKDKGNK
jgi:hypothetical protein